MSLQDRLDALKADFKGGKLGFRPPPDVLATMDRATAELIASGQALGAKKAGDTAPGFTLKDPEGHLVSSAELLAKGPLVISFYRGVWCPYCNLELQALQAASSELEARGASVVAISPQTAPNSRKSLVELYKSFKNDLPAFNDDPAWVLPMPARYVIGTDGIIAYAEVNPDYTQRPDPSELLPVLDELVVTAAA
jgi:peroxiredoxin